MVFDRAQGIEENLRRLIARALADDHVTITRNSTFKSLGLDSLEVVNILVNIEDIYGIDLEDSVLKDIKNMGGLVKYVEAKVAETNKTRRSQRS